MAETPNERLVQRYWRELWSEGDVAVASAFYARSFRLNGKELTPERFAAGAEHWRAYFDGFRADVDFLFSCGDRVVSRVCYRGTHVRDFETVPAAGKSFTGSGIDIFEFSGNQVVEHWHETDHLLLFEQLGAEPRLRSEA